MIGSTELNDWLSGQPPNPWNELLGEALEEYATETEGSETPVDHFIEWLAEWSREARPRQRGLLLTTAHRAKGLEFDHVAILDGGWRAGRNEDADAPRRLYYVAMTRARQTLTLARFPGPHLFQDVLRDNPAALFREPPLTPPPAAPELHRAYRRLSLGDVFLDFTGRKRPSDPVHRAIAALAPGDSLKLNRREIMDSKGTVVGRLASRFKAPTGMRCASATVLAVATWNRNLSEPEYQDKLLCDAWEVVVPELVFEPE